MPGRVLVVLPTYNEAATVGEVLSRVRTAAAEVEVLVVDDNSPDGTASVVEGMALNGVHILRRDRPMGLGSAYRAGFRWGLDRGYDALVEMDADLSHDPAALPDLLATLDSGADLVIGSRYIPGGAIPAWSRPRRALSRWGNRYTDALLHLGIHDATSGYRAYRASALVDIDYERVRANGYGFQIETAYRMVRAGRKVVEYPITFTDRTEGTSKMSGRIVVEALALVTAWGVRDRFKRLTGRTRQGT